MLIETYIFISCFNILIQSSLNFGDHFIFILADFHKLLIPQFLIFRILLDQVNDAFNIRK